MHVEVWKPSGVNNINMYLKNLEEIQNVTAIEYKTNWKRNERIEKEMNELKKKWKRILEKKKK